MKKLLGFLVIVLIFIGCGEEKPSSDVPKFDTTEIKKNTQVKSLFAVPLKDSIAVNPYDLHCGATPPYREYQKFAGHFYGFCSVGCKSNFVKKPSAYLK